MTAKACLRPLVGYLQQLATAAAPEPSDRILLERFAREHDEDAFRTLVQRHAELVFGVCRRGVPCVQDAEDCFQATFLLLARKAGAIRWHGSAAGWLHQVATRVTAEMRVRNARRRRREQEAAVPPARDESNLADLAAIVDEEIERLPERCRGPLLFCYLQGQSRDQAALRLGLSLRTLERRLQAGRNLLRDRLVRRGVTVSAAVMAWQMTQATASALPPSLLTGTSGAAIAFAQGAPAASVPAGAVALAGQVLRGWLWRRVRGTSGWLLAAGLVALGGGWWLTAEPVHEPLAAAQQAPPAVQPQPPQQPPKPALVLQEPATASAVDEGLQWIVRRQQIDGGWKLDAVTANDVAATAFGLLPLLTAGETQPAGKRFGAYAGAVKRGLKALAGMQNADGGFPGGMYAQGLATAALCDGYRLTGDDALKQPAQSAVDFIVQAQHAGGGWRYAPRQAGDTSVTAWQVWALDRGLAAGLAVSKQARQQAMVYLDSVASNNGAVYGYVAPGTGSLAMTAAGLHSRLLLGWEPRRPAAVVGAAHLTNVPPSPLQVNSYYYHFATRALRRIGGEEWDFWEPRMAQVLMDRQERAGDERGSWPVTGDQFGQAGGRLMVTSLALLTLQQCGQISVSAPEKMEKLTDAQAAADWEALLSRDLATARAAIVRLAAHPAVTVALLEARLRPAPPPDAKQLARLIADLNSDEFNVRAGANAELEKLGAAAAPEMRRARKSAASLETRRRLDALIERADPPWQPGRLRLLRAVQVLELTGTAEARQVLERVMRDQPDTTLAQAAQAALERMAQRR